MKDEGSKIGRAMSQIASGHFLSTAGLRPRTH